jgi:hypothetical protein
MARGDMGDLPVGQAHYRKNKLELWPKQTTGRVFRKKSKQIAGSLYPKRFSASPASDYFLRD